MGADANGNGLLDLGEEGSSFNVCSGERGPSGSSPLVVTTAIAPGEQCAAGGRRIDVGYDDGGGGAIAGNGVLEPSEVDDTDLVCNGTPGEAGPTGETGATGAQGERGPMGYASLFSSVPEALGPNCANGGTKVSGGVDLDGNGALDASEVQNTFYTCNGLDAAASPVLARLSAEAAGANCQNGGQRIDIGADDGAPAGTADDGTLQPEEISSTSYVCNGQDGAQGGQGANGFQALVESSPEPAGTNCALGGVKLVSGLDDGNNGGTAQNGTLEPGEVDATNFACSGADGKDGVAGMNGFNTLVATTAEPAGANCASGGVRIDYGMDDGMPAGTANDGVLDSTEVNGSSYVCSGVSGTNGSDGFSTLNNVTAEASGANCAGGGVRIDSGLDDGTPSGTARNGLLEPGEIERTSYVCNGANGTNGAISLVKTSAEPAGANCAGGGIRIDTGLDDGKPTGTAGNGVLEAGEIELTRYVCNGANGTNGTNGIDSLLKTSAEPAGANCAAGGVRVDGGLDDGTPTGTARNGVLEAGEIESTRFVCNGAQGANGTNGLDGNTMLIKTTAEAAGANCVSGGLRVDSGADDGTPTGTARNGVLEVGEIEATRYVCNGTNGTNGTNGLASLVKVTAEAAGANCTAGGVMVQSGLDDGTPSGTANNGALEAGEVSSTQYVCNGSGGSGATMGVGVLKDATNQTLGAVQSVGTQDLTVRSPTGYYYTISWAGTFPDQQIYYSNAGCTGTMWLNAGTMNLSYRYVKFVAYEGKTGNFFVPAGGNADGLASNVAFTAPSFWNSSGGVWQCLGGGTNSGWVLTSIPRATAGIPNGITPPLTIN